MLSLPAAQGAAIHTVSQPEGQDRCDFSVYEGLEVTGAPEYVIFKGRMVTDQGLFRPMTGYGQFLPCPPFTPHLYDKIRAKNESLSVCPVARSEEDMATLNGSEEDIPPEVPEEENKVANQHRSSVDMTSHPQTPDFDEVRNSPSRNSVSSQQSSYSRVRAPPGGQSSGFW